MREEEKVEDGEERSPRRKAAIFLTLGIEVGMGPHVPIPLCW
jgi:hypothetical protein